MGYGSMELINLDCVYCIRIINQFYLKIIKIFLYSINLYLLNGLL